MYYTELAARREATGIWLHVPLPPSLRKTAASLWGLNALSVKFVSVGGNVFTQRNSLHSKCRREGRLQTLGEALGSQPGWRHCSRCGWCLQEYINYLRTGQPPDSEGAENPLFFSYLRSIQTCDENICSSYIGPSALDSIDLARSDDWRLLLGIT